ncbi:MAG: hypothetical protein AABZ33_12500 [Chloroflexota bacterium]
MTSLPPLRYLTGDDVRAAMPPIEERLAHAERTLVALATPGGSQLPPKIGIYPRPEAAFVHAMPAHLRGTDSGDDLVGMKWVAGFSTNNAIGIPSIHGIVVLNDPQTGVPTAILDGGPITAERTAAVSGVAIRRFAPRRSGATVVALVGAGVQGHSHVPVLGHVLPGLHLRIHDPSADRAVSLAAFARATEGIADVTTTDSARDAIEGADVVVTAASFTTPERRQSMTNDWLGPETLVVPIDYATYCAAEVARDAALFLVDDRAQFLYNRDAGQFDGYPDPGAMLGEAMIAGTARPAGRVVVTHLGVGLADVVFADAILRRAAERGLGIDLPR